MRHCIASNIRHILASNKCVSMYAYVINNCWLLDVKWKSFLDELFLLLSEFINLNERAIFSSWRRREKKKKPALGKLNWIERQNMVIAIHLNWIFFSCEFGPNNTMNIHTFAYQMNGELWVGTLLKVVCLCKSRVELLFVLLTLFSGCKWECVFYT